MKQVALITGASWIEKFVISFMPMIFKKSFLKIMTKTQELHVDYNKALELENIDK